MATDTLTRAKYAGLDFDTHSDDLRARIQVKFAADFNDFAVSSMGIVLMDMVAYGLDTLSFYLDQRATDLYLSTSRTRGSVSRLTRQLGYKMSPAVASSVDVEVNLKQVYGFDITIFKGFQFKGPNELVFESAEDVTFAANTPVSTKKKIPCYEGESFTESFTSDGSANQLFRLRRVTDGKFVVSGTVNVIVDGSEWEEKEFLKYEASDHFEVGYNDDPATVRFGNGRTGNIPPSGAAVVVSYIASSGKSGQVAKNTITKEYSPLVVNFQTISLNVNNPAGTVGGDDPETLEQAKASAPRVFKTRQVAVTKSDYESLAGTFADPLFGRVAVAQALSTRSSDADIELQNQLDAITTAVSTPVSASSTALTSIGTSTSTVATQLSTISTITTAVKTKNDSITTSADSALTQVRSARNLVQEIVADAADITAVVGVSGTLRTFVNAIPTDPTSQLSTADKASIIAYIDAVKLEAEAIAAQGPVVTSYASSAASSIGTIKDKAAEVGITGYASTAELGKLDTARTSISTQNSNIITQASTITTALTDAYDDVADAVVAIDEHYDLIYASDCKTNVITVPILSRDGGGFYASPSAGLISSLQEYLDARKEVTQTVVVTSGEGYLVPAKLTVRLGVLSNFSLSVVQTAVSAKIDNLLRDRKFKQSLYLSDIKRDVVKVPGVAFVNVTINGYLDDDEVTVLTDKNDASGNLIASEEDIITKGSVTLTVEAVA